MVDDNQLKTPVAGTRRVPSAGEERHMMDDNQTPVAGTRRVPSAGVERHMMDDNQLKLLVSERYAAVAEGTATCGSLCGCTDNADSLASVSAIPLTSWPHCPRVRISACPVAIRKHWRQCSRVKPCSIWAAERASTASWPPARSGRPAA